MIAREEMHLARAAVDYADTVFKYAHLQETNMEEHMMARFVSLWPWVYRPLREFDRCLQHRPLQ